MSVLAFVLMIMSLHKLEKSQSLWHYASTQFKVIISASSLSIKKLKENARKTIMNRSFLNAVIDHKPCLEIKLFLLVKIEA